MHNFYRFKHNASPLSLCPLLQQSAQRWADRLISQPGLTNSPEAKSGAVGENLFRKVMTARPPKNKPGLPPGATTVPKVKAPTSAKEVVEYWYNHHGKYDWKNGNGVEAGAFTQVVWKRSREVGFGVARSGDDVVVVAHYSPPGNIAGHYAANVSASSTVFESMSGRKRNTEILLYRAATGVVTVKKTSKEYIDKQGNFVRSTKFVMGKPGCGPPIQNKHIRAKSSEKKSNKIIAEKTVIDVIPANPGTKTKRPGRHTDSSSSSSSSSDDEKKKGLRK